MLEELTDEDVAGLVKELGDAKVDSVAVCLLFAFRDPSHERRIASALRQSLPDLHVSASHEVPRPSGSSAFLPPSSTPTFATARPL